MKYCPESNPLQSESWLFSIIFRQLNWNISFLIRALKLTFTLEMRVVPTGFPRVRNDSKRQRKVVKILLEKNTKYYSEIIQRLLLKEKLNTENSLYFSLSLSLSLSLSPNHVGFIGYTSYFLKLWSPKLPPPAGSPWTQSSPYSSIFSIPTFTADPVWSRQ